MTTSIEAIAQVATEDEPEVIPKALVETCAKTGIACITTELYKTFRVAQGTAKLYDAAIEKADIAGSERDFAHGALRTIESKLITAESKSDRRLRENERLQMHIEVQAERLVEAESISFWDVVVVGVAVLAGGAAGYLGGRLLD